MSHRDEDKGGRSAQTTGERAGSSERRSGREDRFREKRPGPPRNGYRGGNRDERPDGRSDREGNRSGGFRGRTDGPAKDRGEERPDNRRPGGRGSRSGDLAAVRDIDEEIVRLIMRRAFALSKMRSRGRLNPEVEKELRLAWERTAARLSRDTRLSREMFSLLQAVDPLPRDEESSAYNLSPLPKPMEVDVAAPVDLDTVRCWAALAAASGQPLKLEKVTLTHGLIDCIKALKQIGGKLRWEDDGRVENAPGGSCLMPGMDKVIYVGSDAFAFWLVLALSLGAQARLKITGVDNLRFISLGAVRRFLPGLGARLTNVIPAQDGLPVRIECSGMVPEEVVIPADVSVDFVRALLLAAPFRAGGERLILPEEHLDLWWPKLLPVVRVLEHCGYRWTREQNILVLTRGDFKLPLSPQLGMDVPLCASLLALPALSGGSVRLEGAWPAAMPVALMAERMLKEMGLTVTIEAQSVVSHREETAVQAGPSDELRTGIRETAPELLPLVTLFAAAVGVTGTAVSLYPASLLSQERFGVMEGFLAQVNLKLSEAGGLAKIEDAQFRTAAWLSPGPLWTVALALASYLRPNIRLANPGSISDRYPLFWTLFNGLPKPDLTRKQHQEPQDEQKPHRRFIAAGVYGDPPPDLPAGDDS